MGHLSCLFTIVKKWSTLLHLVYLSLGDWETELLVTLRMGRGHLVNSQLSLIAVSPSLGFDSKLALKNLCSHFV